MTKAVEVFLVGDQDSPKTNSWLAMTNNRGEALNLLETLEEACTYKSITVKEPKRDSK